MSGKHQGFLLRHVDEVEGFPLDDTAILATCELQIRVQMRPLGWILVRVGTGGLVAGEAQLRHR